MRTLAPLVVLIALLVGCGTGQRVSVGSIATREPAHVHTELARYALIGHPLLQAVELEVRDLAGRATAVVATRDHDGTAHTTVLGPAAALDVLAIFDLDAPGALEPEATPLFDTWVVGAMARPTMWLRATDARGEARLWMVELAPQARRVFDLAMAPEPASHVFHGHTVDSLTLSVVDPGARAAARPGVRDR